MNGARRDVLERLLAALLPEATAELLLRDLGEARRRRLDRGEGTAAQRWYRRQLLAALLPWRLMALRRVRPRPDDRFSGQVSVPPLQRPLLALEGAAQDLRYAARLLRRSPGMAALIVVVLSGGLGTSIFTWSLLNSMMLKPLPLPGGESIVRVLAVQPAGFLNLMDGYDVAAIRDSVTSLEDLGTYRDVSRLLRGGTLPRTVSVTQVEPHLFRVAATAPMLGRTLDQADGEPGAEPVAVLGHTLWRVEFGADPGIVGRSISLNGIDTRVVGVMPEGFGFPVWTQLWVALPADEVRPLRRGEGPRDVFARLAAGATLATADAELATLMQRWRRVEPVEDPEGEVAVSARALTFPMSQMGDEGGFVFVLLNFAAGLILLLACINVGNLMLSRAAERMRETTVRLALGAPRLRLVLQMMTESALLALIGGALALLLAGKALTAFDAWMRATSPDGMPFWWRWQLDTDTVLAACGFVALAVLMVGAVPAWRASGASADAVLRDGGRGSLGGAAGRVTRALVVVQVGVIAVLMFLGGVSGYLAHRAGNLDVGLATDRVLVTGVRLPTERYGDGDQRLDMFDRLHDLLAGSPAIESVLLRASIDGASEWRYAVEGVGYESLQQQPRAATVAIAGSLDTLGIRSISGRVFDEGDVAGAGPIALVSESLARARWGETSALGQRLRLGSADGDGRWLTVTGVVSDTLVGNPFSRDHHYDSIYVPFAQVPSASVRVAYRHAGDPRAAVLALYDAVASVDPEIHPEPTTDYEEMFDTMGRMASLATNVFTGCFLFALMLAVTGIYGLASRSVVQRTGEIGIRRALGATEGSVIGLFLRHGSRQALIGLGAGLTVVVIAAAVMARYLVLDPRVYLAAALIVPAVIVAVVLAAVYLPTRRAVRLEPSVALWRE